MRYSAASTMVSPPARPAALAPVPGPVQDRILPLYAYLRPLLGGRRVLELGGAGRAGADFLASQGAASVLSVARVAQGAAAPVTSDEGRARHVAALSLTGIEAEGPFDLVLIPDAHAYFAPGGPLSWATLRQLLAPGGQLCCSVASADAHQPIAPALGYYTVLDALSAHFASVRMFGQTPFVALGIAEFDAAGAPGLRIESTLVDPEREEPTHYLALASTEPLATDALGYALVQIEARPGAPPAAARGEPAAGAPTGELAELTRKLAAVEGELQGVLRVSRAQTEELEELRARLRRAAEVRAELDEEVARLRKALAQADESVLSLTRRTADEMSALAERLTTGLRAGLAPGAPASDAQVPGAQSERLQAELREREALLAQRESALSERDERIVALELDKQDLLWRLRGLEAQAAGAARAPAAAGAPGVTLGDAALSPRDAEAQIEELRAALAVRERLAHELRAAAGIQAREAESLRAALAERTAHSEELEEALALARASEAQARAEAERLRARMVEIEDGDRTRRRRLAELEGQLLRWKHQAAQTAEAARRDATAAQASLDRELRAQVAAAELRIADLEAQLAQREAQLRAAEAGRTELEARWGEAVEEVTGLQRQIEHDRMSLAMLERELGERLVGAAAADPAEALRVQDATREAAEQDVRRLRDALERSDEELRRTRAQLLPLRDRVSELESERDARIEAELDFFRALSREAAALEEGLRAELLEVERVLRSFSGQEGAMRADAPATGDTSGPARAE